MVLFTDNFKMFLHGRSALGKPAIILLVEHDVLWLLIILSILSIEWIAAVRLHQQ